MLIGLDNQAAIKALNNQSPHPSHYLLDHIHTTIENLHEKQDKLQNANNFQRARHTANPLIANSHGVIDLKLQWVPGHVDIPPNEKADSNAKRAARKNQSPGNILPKILRKPLPFSISAIWQKKKLQIHHKWLWQWKTSSRYPGICTINKTTPLKKWLQLVSELTQVQASNYVLATLALTDTYTALNNLTPLHAPTATIHPKKLYTTSYLNPANSTKKDLPFNEN